MRNANQDDATMFEIMKQTNDDFFCRGKNYFSCGYGGNPYYNINFVNALAVIGDICGKKSGKDKNFHKGIAYIAGKLDISKRQVKCLRRKMKTTGRGGKKAYVFKVPFLVEEITREIITALKKNQKNPKVSCFLSNANVELYRTLLISAQYDAINSIFTINPGIMIRDEIVQVRKKLFELTDRIG